LNEVLAIMVKNVLIISPNFPPVNAADMHRVRHMLSYIQTFNWTAEVIAVDPNCLDSYNSELLLLKTIPSDIPIHLVRAWNKKFTSKFGLGSISMRSFFFFLQKGNQLIKKKKFDLIFFSTTAFHVMALGPYWKKKFGIPFVLDIQDPWRSDHYLKQPSSQRPPKFWISYFLDSFLEKLTIPKSDAIISVSSSYIDTFKLRYPQFNGISKVIPFSIHQLDFQVAFESDIKLDISFDTNQINIVYIGRGGHDLTFSVNLLFSALNLMKNRKPELFSKITCYFLGTSYASVGKGIETIKPVAIQLGLGEKVIEMTDRLPYFSTLRLIKSAQLLFIPGSMEEGYTASKIYPYILAEKPIVAIFHEKSSVIKILKDCTNGSVISFGNIDFSSSNLIEQVFEGLLFQINNINTPQRYNEIAFEPYMAKSMTKNVINVFEKVCSSN
jgi:hypothetical protein